MPVYIHTTPSQVGYDFQVGRVYWGTLYRKPWGKLEHLLKPLLVILQPEQCHARLGISMTLVHNTYTYRKGIITTIIHGIKILRVHRTLNEFRSGFMSSMPGPVKPHRSPTADHGGTINIGPMIIVCCPARLLAPVILICTEFPEGHHPTCTVSSNDLKHDETD
ncbi:hypothetical protein IAQ61_009055 [Plenodomus lingam]|uniref:uncharacterized protein n=1 Tax=Leptosphaeria maculans TaxID=5022 RepID=UPI00331F8C36|nr:hypothetical protein IAQ61_009055 [Plenodomus lingam]